jgi:glutamate synthase domain-containing protein 2
LEYIFYILILLVINQIVYDKYIQREKQLLINYPLIGRFRYFFEALREPFRQYFGDEDFYESKDKIDWVYNAAQSKNGYISFSPSQPLPNPKFLIKHSNIVNNQDEVDDDFSVEFGKERKYPFKTKSIISRSAMSDGALSPEGTKAFTKGAYLGNFPINTGEGGLTTNFLFTHKNHDEKYMTIIKLSKLDKYLYTIISKVLNHYTAIQFLKSKHINKGEIDTFIFDRENLKMYRPKWDAPLENFPKEVPDDIPDIIFQLSSGFYGCRNEDGSFNDERYQKVMSFCKMSEIKVAQGAKQTGGKLVGEKVTPSIAYFRNVKVGESILSPNRIPTISNTIELFDFVAKLQRLSEKPVGIKIVISSKEGFKELVEEIYRRKKNKLVGIPDFITIDGGDGGSATAPLYLMDMVGLEIKDAIFIADMMLKEYGLRDDIKLIASSRILTPDDVVVNLSLGADFVSIARGFMLSAGCIRAKMCSGEGSHNCPIGLATQKEHLRRSYLLHKQAKKIQNYHNGLLIGIKTMLAIMGKKNYKELQHEDLSYIDKNGFIHSDINRYLDKKLYHHSKEKYV